MSIISSPVVHLHVSEILFSSKKSLRNNGKFDQHELDIKAFQILKFHNDPDYEDNR